MLTDIDFMNIALQEAFIAFKQDEVPIGAVLVQDGRILAHAHNAPIAYSDPSAHAEMLALRKACQKTGNYRLTGAALYVTLEPCIMCAGAILQARLAQPERPATLEVQGVQLLLKTSLRWHSWLHSRKRITTTDIKNSRRRMP